jgi:hypothetical protein
LCLSAGPLCTTHLLSRKPPFGSAQCGR